MRGWLLDTNVVSEPTRPRPDRRVLEWIAGVPVEKTFISIVTLGEIDKGIETLRETDDRRAQLLRFRAALEAEFSGRVISLENETVRLWGAMAGRYRRSLGGEAHVVDTLLAATAQRHHLYLATRNVRDVRGLGGHAFNPWIDDPANFPLQA